MAPKPLKRSIILQQIVVLTSCAVIDMFTGSILEEMKRSIEMLPGLIIMIPPLIDLRGNIGCALGSRLGSALHLGTIKPRFAMSAELRANVISAIIVSVLGSLAIGLMSLVTSLIVGVTAISFPKLLFIALLSGVLSGLIIVPVTVLLAFVSFRRGWDPDNVTGPVMTTLGDVVTVSCIVLSVFLSGWL
jgi:mgtE-like transporter